MMQSTYFVQYVDASETISKQARQLVGMIFFFICFKLKQYHRIRQVHQFCQRKLKIGLQKESMLQDRWIYFSSEAEILMQHVRCRACMKISCQLNCILNTEAQVKHYVFSIFEVDGSCGKRIFLFPTVLCVSGT